MNNFNKGNMVNVGGGYNQNQYNPQQQWSNNMGQQMNNPYAYQNNNQQFYNPVIDRPAMPTQDYLDREQMIYQEQFLRKYAQQNQPNYNNMYNNQFNPYAQAQAQKQQAIDAYNKSVEQANINRMLYKATQRARGVEVSEEELDRLFSVNIDNFIQTPNYNNVPVYDPEDQMIHRARMIEENHQRGNKRLEMLKQQGFVGTPMLEQYPQNMSYEDFCNDQTYFIEHSMKEAMAQQNKSSNCYNRDNYRSHMNSYSGRFDNNVSMDDNSIPSYYKVNNQEYARRRSQFIDSIKGGVF